MDQRFRWNDRLHYQREFKRVYQEGRRFSASGLTVWVLRRQDDEEPRNARLGLAISKSYGNAVARNRMKRLLREVFRLNKAGLPPGADMVFSARPTLGNPRYQTIEPIVLKLWSLAHLQPPLRAS